MPIPVDSLEHLNRKVEKRNKLEIEKSKNKINENKKEISISKIGQNYRTNDEGTFKNSIRNKYKRKNKQI